MVQNYFELIVMRMRDLGFYGYFFPFVLTLAIVWALLNKSKILGNNQTVIGAVSLVVGLLVFGFPIITGTNLAEPMSIFFTQSIVIMMGFIVVVLIASILNPSISEWLSGVFKMGNFNTITAVVIILLIMSGLVSTFWSIFKTPDKPGKNPGAPMDVRKLAAGLILFVVFIMIAASSKSG